MKKRIVGGLLAAALLFFLLPMETAAVTPIETVHVTLSDEMQPKDGMAIPSGSFPDRSADVKLAEGETGYSIFCCYWNACSYSAGVGEKATGTFKEGNTYWLYIVLECDSSHSFPEGGTDIWLNGTQVASDAGFGGERVSCFVPYTIGTQQYWTLTFDGNGYCTPSVNEVTVKGGYSMLDEARELDEALIWLTATPQEGYYFTGWYLDSACTVPFYPASNQVYQSMTVYAGYMPKPTLTDITGIVLQGDTLRWNAVEGAKLYHVTFTRGAKTYDWHYYTNEADLPHGLGWYGAMGGDPALDGVYELTITAGGKEYESQPGNGVLSNRTFAGTYLYHDPSGPQNPFVDVAASDYFYDPVMWAVSHEPQVTQGMDATHFAPNEKCTRAQVVTFLWRAAGRPEPTQTVSPFVDVPADQYYYKAVLWAVEQNITEGMDATHFAPGGDCTRAQVVTFLWRANAKPAPAGSEHPFVDVETTAYYFNAVLWAVEQAITQGMDATHFQPDTACSRAQIVTFLHRAESLHDAPLNVLSEDTFLMYVEDQFNIIERGKVLTGRVVSGTLHTGDRIVVRSYDPETKQSTAQLLTVEQIEMFRKILDEAQKGDNIGILVSGVSDSLPIYPGDALVSQKSNLQSKTGDYVGTLTLNTSFSIPFQEGDKKQFYYGNASDVTTTILHLPEGELGPGETCEGVVVGNLARPCTWYVGQELTVRVGGKTQGTFTITEVLK